MQSCIVMTNTLESMKKTFYIALKMPGTYDDDEGELMLRLMILYLFFPTLMCHKFVKI